MAHGYNYFLWTLDISLDLVSLRSLPFPENHSPERGRELGPWKEVCYSFPLGGTRVSLQGTVRYSDLDLMHGFLPSGGVGGELVSLGGPAPPTGWETGNQISTCRLELLRSNHMRV